MTPDMTPEVVNDLRCREARFVTFEPLPRRRRDTATGACDICGAVVPERSYERHARWHSNCGDLEERGKHPPLTVRNPPTVMVVDGRSVRLFEVYP